MRLDKIGHVQCGRAAGSAQNAVGDASADPIAYRDDRQRQHYRRRDRELFEERPSAPPISNSKRAIYIHGFPGLPDEAPLEAIGPKGRGIGTVKPMVVDSGAWKSSDDWLADSQINVSDE
jgi:hypothetical protein